MDKFTLLADLGTITVPADYDHTTWFDEKNREGFSHHDDAITDVNFPKPSRILKPGDKLHVQAFRQVMFGATTSEERMAFLATQKVVHTGAQGIPLVWEQKRDQLPKSYWYISFDEKEALGQDASGDHYVLRIGVDAVGEFSFTIGFFEDPWYDNDAFLCFSELSAEVGIY